MDQLEIDKTFIVTQWINPNDFILFNPELADNVTRKNLEKNLKKEVQSHASIHKTFKKGDIVIYYWDEGKRYIRCELDDIKVFNGIQYYFLFALDYGVSLYSTRIDDIFETTEIYRYTPTPIMTKVSLSVLPTITNIDFIENKKIISINEKWCELAMKICKKIIDKAAVITFEISDQLPKYKDYVFGDLKLTTFYGLKISLCDTLVEANLAKYASSPKEFQKYFDLMLKRNVERWNDDRKTGGVLKQEEGKFALYYEDVIRMNKYISTCESVQNRMFSCQKVMEWQEKIEGFEYAVPASDMSEKSSIDWKSECSTHPDDEGFEEKIDDPRSIFMSKFGVARNVKKIENDEDMSEISQSLSQPVIPRSEKWIKKHGSLKKFMN